MSIRRGLFVAFFLVAAALAAPAAEAADWTAYNACKAPALAAAPQKCVPGETRVQSAYFQSTKAAIGYQSPNGYDVCKAADYARDIQKYARTQTAPACLDWKVFWGVDSTGLALRWINEDGCLNPTEKDELYHILKTTAGPDGAPMMKIDGRSYGPNGYVRGDRFFCSMKKTLSVFNKPLFAVVDSNYFHHSGPFVVRALDTHAGAQHDKKPIKLLVHFDAHPDYSGGDKVEKYLHCDTWINAVTQKELVDKVLWVGKQYVGCGDFTQNEFAIGKAAYIPFKMSSVQKTKERQDAQVKLTGPLGQETIADQLKYLVPVGAIADVYITIDRDLMIHSKTGWKDGPHTEAKVLRAVQDVVDFVKARKGSHLIGFDVTGLPEVGGGTQKLFLKDDCTGDERIQPGVKYPFHYNSKDGKQTSRAETNQDDTKDPQFLEHANRQILAFYKLFVDAHAPRKVEGYVSQVTNANAYTVLFTNPEWAVLSREREVAERLKDGKPPKLDCHVGTGTCTVEKVYIQSGSSAGGVLIKTTGVKTPFGTNTKVFLQASE